MLKECIQDLSDMNVWQLDNHGGTRFYLSPADFPFLSTICYIKPKENLALVRDLYKNGKHRLNLIRITASVEVYFDYGEEYGSNRYTLRQLL